MRELFCCRVSCSPSARTGHDGGVTTWEYLIVELPGFVPPTHAPGASAAVHALNEEGERGWEAVGMTPLADGRVAVLFKKPSTPIRAG